MIGGLFRRNPKIIGLTGGIASGKSLVAEFLTENGIPGIDADEVAKKLRQTQARPMLIDRFGTAETDELREIVFNDPRALKDLEAILHPLIKKESEKRLRSLGKPIVFYEAALLVETGRYRDFDALVVVDAPYEIRLGRLMKRNGYSEELAKKILETQLSDDVRNAAADYVIENQGTIEELRQRVKELSETLKSR